MRRSLADHLERRTVRVAILGCALVLYLFIAYRGAWLSDDAFISLRTADNALNGYGLRWNVDERVQTFTHPLWLFFLIGAHALSGEPFYSSLCLSWLVSGAAIGVLLFACSGRVLYKLTAIVILLCSRAFMDFSSSGLENPLTHLFLIAFVAVLSLPRSSTSRVTAACWLAVGAALNRLDTSLLFAPALVLELVRSRHDLRVAERGAALLPLVVWESFSIIYYGFPFPNTAYAKLSQSQVATPIVDGLNYLYSSLLIDPVTLCAIGCCFVAALARRDFLRAGYMLGAALYLAYVVRIGGDFMKGRFLSAPLCLCVACLSTSDWLRTRGALLVSASALALAGLFNNSEDNSVQRPIAHYIDRFGIHDERGLFFPINSLRHAATINPMMQTHPWSDDGFEMRDAARESGRMIFRVVNAIGHAGYFGGPRVHLVDQWALADALIARLPAVFGKFGHFPRVIPDGYVATLATGKNQIRNPDLAEYNRQLRLIVSGRIWEPERLRAILNFNMGAYDSLSDRYSYYRGPKFRARLHFTNPTDHPCVATYVWNDFTASAYELDCASQRGKTYDLTWEVSASGATLVSPEASAHVSNLVQLGTAGMFTMSVALLDVTRGPITTLHEARYTFSRSGEQMLVQRQPWHAWTENFDQGYWHDGSVPGVLEIDDLP